MNDRERYWREGRPCAQVVCECPDCGKNLGSPGEAHWCLRPVGSAANVTIREVSAEDQAKYERPRFVVCNPISGTDYTVFGSVQGGETRAEAVFWAERLASKNGLRFERPEGWENVEGALP